MKVPFALPAIFALANRDIKEGTLVTEKDITHLPEELSIQMTPAPPENIHRGTAEQILDQVRRNKAAASSSPLPLESSSLASCVSHRAYYTSAKALDLISQIVADKRITPAQAIAAITGITDQTLKKTEDFKTQDTR